jgi:membrane fusion protein (multidrug efflux system)
MSDLSAGRSERLRARFRQLVSSRLRPILMIGIPAIVILAGVFWFLAGGQYVSTDNAYVKADTVAVSPKVSGTIEEVFVQENQMVEAGEPLFLLDTDDHRIALDEAEAQLHQAAAKVKGQQARYKMTLERMDLAKANAEYYQREFARQNQLAKRDFASKQKLDEARHNLETATQLAKILAASMGEIVAELDGAPEAPVEQHSAYRVALGARDNAALNLKRTIVRAPFAGVLGKQPQIGDTVAAGTPVVSLISRDHVWVEANFKETQLTNVQPGQKVSIEIDTYPGHEWEGEVASIAQGTGAEFSILPAQNSTGNWVKVVQRIPVRIAIERREDDPAIRAGMSCEVEIDTDSGPVRHASVQKGKAS